MAKHISKSHSSNNKIPEKVRMQNEEAERIAREKAERLFTPAERAKANEPDAPRQQEPEPSLEERLRRIEERSKQRVKEEQAALASEYLTDAKNKFKRAISNTTDEELKKAFEEMQRLEKLAGDVSNGSQGGEDGKRFGMGKNGESSTRVRRSPDDLKADAEKLVAYLKENPNSKGSAAIEATGAVVKQPLNVRTFIEKYLPGTKVKTQGEKAGTTYSIG